MHAPRGYHRTRARACESSKEAGAVHGAYDATAVCCACPEPLLVVSEVKGIGGPGCGHIAEYGGCGGETIEVSHGTGRCLVPECRGVRGKDLAVAASAMKVE